MTDKYDRKIIIANNIRSLLTQHKMTQSTLASMIGVSKSTLSDYLNYRSAPSYGVIQKIADVFDVNKSDIDTTFKDEQSSNISYMSKSNNYNYFDTGISAGMLMEVDPFTKDDVQQITLSDVIMGKYAGNQDIIISHVNGESMNRVLPNRSLIAIKKFYSIDDLRDGDIVVFQDASDMSVKRFYNDTNSNIVTFSPDSIDPSYKPINYRYEDLDNVQIIGKVVVYTVEV